MRVDPKTERQKFLEELLSELGDRNFLLHNEEGEITYFAIGEWLLSKRHYSSIRTR
jgi:hypothetical protein